MSALSSWYKAQLRAPTEELGFRQYLLRVTLAKIDFWSEVLPQCILQLFSKKTFSSPRLRLRGFLSYPGSSSTFITVTTGSPGDGIGPEAGRLRFSHWAGPSVTGSAKVSQSFYRGIIIVILTKGKPVPLAWEFIYKLGEVTRVTSTILTNMGRKCITEA